MTRKVTRWSRWRGPLSSSGPDQPPFSIAVLALVRALFGESLPVVRAVPMLLGAATVYVTGLLARELGGGRGAVFLSCLAVIAAPIVLGTNHVYSMNSFDLLFWPLAALALLRCHREPSAGRWLLVGLVLGLGLLNKSSVLWLGAGLAAGLLLTGERRRLRTPGPWLAAAVAALFFLPYVIWNAVHGFPTLEFMRNAMEQKMVRATPLDFLASQILDTNPAAAPIWIAGLVSLLRGPEGRARVLGVAFLVVAAILVIPGTSKPEYLAPAYPMLLAAGGAVFERWSRAPRLGWLPGALAVAMLAFAAVALPMALPVLSPDAFVRYTRAIGFSPSASERHARVELPQHYADMFGWEEMAEHAAAAYRSLTPAERARCVVIAQNYGEAGALELFGARHGLPRVICGHNAYGFWGYGDWDGSVAVVVGGGEAFYRRHFEEVVRVGTIPCERCMEYERSLPVFVVRGIRGPVERYFSEERFLL
ncbi:MAG TPA: glycosyltransferase family 39 protein [Acidobacteriota bacterium]|nr:glycosyltransferase family 39 protein [Acidobacteriota bacterium]